MKILMNYGDWNANDKRRDKNAYGAVGYYRFKKVAEQIKGHEVNLIGKEILHFGDNIEEQWDNVFKEYDVFWTGYFADPNAGAAIYYHRTKHNKKVVIDVDDNYLDVPESNQLYEKFKPTKKDRAYLGAILSLADALTVSTEPLKEKLHKHILEVYGIDKPIYVLPNFNDLKDWDFKPAEKHKDRVVIGYQGSHSHKDDLELIIPVIRNLMFKHKNLWFEVLGMTTMPELAKMLKGFNNQMLERVALLGSADTFSEWPPKLAEQKWDIGIAPLVDTPFTRSKSHIKWMEYAMYKIPCVASRVYPYFMELNGKQTIEDGVTGFLAKNTKEFEEKLNKLIESPKLRREIGENAYKFIEKEWQYKDSPIDSVVNEMLKSI